MESERKVTIEQGKISLLNIVMNFFKTSSKESNNVSESFITMTRDIIKSTDSNKKTPTKVDNNVIFSNECQF